MGNIISEEEQEERFLEDGFNLESPDADKVINYGTAAPVWQNKTSTSSRSLDNDNNNNNNNNNIRSSQYNNNDGSNHRNQKGQEVVAASSTHSEPPPPRRSTSSNSCGEGTTSNNTSNSNSNSSNNNNNNNSSSSHQSSAAAMEDAPQNTNDEPTKKLSYLQMAKLGYQELINAIIRPPRADYKVRVSRVCVYMHMYIRSCCRASFRISFSAYIRWRHWDHRPLTIVTNASPVPILHYGPNGGIT